jgi:hypothetical protein
MGREGMEGTFKLPLSASPLRIAHKIPGRLRSIFSTQGTREFAVLDFDLHVVR